MKILVLNVAITGLNDPHIVQLNYIEYDIRINHINAIESHIFKSPTGDTNETFSGVSNISANNSIADLMVELPKLFYHFGQEFTIDMILRVIEQNPDKFDPDIKTRLLGVSTYCTMRSSVICNPFNSFSHEYPNIHELSQLLFANESHQNYTNNAYKKLLMTLRCFCMKKYSFDINIVNNQFNAHYELIDDEIMNNGQ